MDSSAKRSAASDDLGELFEQRVGAPWDWSVEEVHHTSLIVTYADVVTDEPRVAKITPADVIDYYWNYGGSHGFEASVRYLGPKILGDWRPIDNLAHMCLAWFTAACRAELIEAAAKHSMTLIS
ncbi:hypothetical protein SMC3_08190 [Candidatus Cryosericum hinesii]|jgi:hypothetical protein|uniref:Uncharacterized protein n=1 Tax=Candidatus Cryosericum hinesii TaxID=2290915 RepID=A0A398DHS0_9BACT|nr:hypothetical protein [Candidatus Cryosericum hinesii]RIE11757.1 hypothetical protein SMC3_08190 [Candidatus Cryosericum hinesii]